MRLPERLDPPEQVVVCDYCLRAGCWNGLLPCVGISQGNPRKCTTLTADEAAGYAYEEPSFWHGPRAAGQVPRDVLELLDVVRYLSTRTDRAITRDDARVYLVGSGIDLDQVDAALEQAWPARRAS
jgi:hypothetical protein